MPEMEDKFQEILGNEAAMSQIMSIAQSLSSPSDSAEGEDGWESVGQSSPVNLEGVLGGLDPAMMALGMKLVAAYQQENRTSGLMEALRPFVKEERHIMMDKMAQATKIAQVLCSLWETWGEEKEH